jgi:hypothetical protein
MTNLRGLVLCLSLMLLLTPAAFAGENSRPALCTWRDKCAAVQLGPRRPPLPAKQVARRPTKST